MSSKPKEPPAEISLDILHLQLIPNSLRSVLTLMQNNAWDAVGNSLNFIWSILPPKTSGKFPERPSIQLEQKMEIAKRIASRNLNPKDNEIRQGEHIEVQRNEAGMNFCYAWIRQLIDQLALDGYLFQGNQVIMTEERKATQQPPSADVQRTMPRS